jgi:peptidoglycan hydrolase-like protein with peptidoglycan-binding domain
MGQRKKTGVMTAEAFSSVPFSAGAAVASAVGRLALSGLGVYLRAPLRNTAMAGLVTLCAMAGSNALYKQSHHHPAPLFGNFETTAESQGADPVMPAVKPKKLEKVAAKVSAPALEKPVATAKTVGNDDVLAIQQRLQVLGLLDGKVDGLFGPRTIRAIKAFEAKAGRPVKGQLTPEIVALIKATPAFAAPVPTPEPVVTTTETKSAAAPDTAAPLPLTATAAKVTAVVVEPVAETDPLPAPAPLVSAPMVEAASGEPVAATEITATVEASAPLPDVSPTVDAATSAVAKRTVQTIAVRATPAPAPQAMPAELDPPAAGTIAATDPKIVAAIQRGLASLGFLHGVADGVAGEATAKAIRNFEIYFNYDVTGRITPDLVKLLVQNGAII